MNSLTVMCPHCQNPFPLDEALAHQYEEANKQELEKAVELKIAEDKVKLRKQMEEWQKEQQEKLKQSAQKELDELRSENERRESKFSYSEQ